MAEACARAVEGHLWQECALVPGQGAGGGGVINRSHAYHSTGAKAINQPPSPTLAIPPGCLKYFILLKMRKQVGLLSLEKLATTGLLKGCPDT